MPLQAVHCPAVIVSLVFAIANPCMWKERSDPTSRFSVTLRYLNCVLQAKAMRALVPPEGRVTNSMLVMFKEELGGIAHVDDSMVSGRANFINEALHVRNSMNLWSVHCMRMCHLLLLVHTKP